MLNMLAEMNGGLLDTYYTFKPGAPLKPFLMAKKFLRQLIFTLEEVRLVDLYENS
jgi:hypothetical protein